MLRLHWLLLCPALLLRAADASQVEVEQKALNPGSTTEIVVRFVPSPEQVSGVQFDVNYDSSALEVIPLLGDAPRNSLKSLYTADISPGRKRFVITGWNQTPILDGSLVTLLVNARATAPLRSYPVTLSNLTMSHPNGLAAAAAGQDGSVTVEAGIGPLLTAARVLHAASLTAGPLAPGEVVTLLAPNIGPIAGTLPSGAASSTALAGTSLWFGATSAPLLYGGPGQINAIVPFDSGNQTSTDITVRRSGNILASVTAPVQAAVPGIFTLDYSGTGAAAVLNQDSTLNSYFNPAARGDFISIFATGAGQLDPPGVDGALGKGIEQHPRLPVSVSVDGIDAEVSYAGAAPGLISGVLQVNCRIPAGVQPGPAVGLVLIVGESASPPGPTIAVR